MYVAGYSFQVLNNAFASHWGFQYLKNRCQFHQHFSSSFFIWKCFVQLFSNYSLALYLFVKRISMQKLLVISWWTWLQAGVARQAAREEQRKVWRLRQGGLGEVRPRPVPDVVQAQEDEPEEFESCLLKRNKSNNNKEITFKKNIFWASKRPSE